MPVNVGITRGVGLDKMKIIVGVAVGSGVFVLGGVGVMVSVGVEEGIAAAVCVDAAFTVCTMKVPTALGSVVGIAGARDGAHAMITARAMNQIKNLLLCVFIFHLTNSICIHSGWALPVIFAR
jgi:hypothetical protein